MVNNLRGSLRNTIQNLLPARVLPKGAKKEVIGGATTPSPSVPPSDSGADFRALFGGSLSKLPATPAVTVPRPALPTAQSVFGANPWVSNPGGVAPNGVSYGYNPEYFATRSTADKLAQMYGGTVMEANAITPYGPFKQNQLNEMIQFPNGNVVNAGILASYFNRGLTQEQIDQAIGQEIRVIPG